MTKNLLTFCCSTPLLPLAYLLSKILKIDFQNRENPLSGLGSLVSLNQMLYLLIALWIYAAVPEKMLMVYAMIFGAIFCPMDGYISPKVTISFLLSYRSPYCRLASVFRLLPSRFLC